MKKNEKHLKYLEIIGKLDDYKEWLRQGEPDDW